MCLRRPIGNSTLTIASRVCDYTPPVKNGDKQCILLSCPMDSRIRAFEVTLAPLSLPSLRLCPCPRPFTPAQIARRLCRTVTIGIQAMFSDREAQVCCVYGSKSAYLMQYLDHSGFRPQTTYIHKKFLPPSKVS